MSVPLICTASWVALYRASRAGPLDVLPVRTSRGRPKFWPEAYDFPAVEELMPAGWMLKMSGAEFAHAFRKRLAGIGFDAIVAALEGVPNPEGKRLALACYEDVIAGQECHRRNVAEFWTVRTGELVPEWVEPGKLVRLVRGDGDESGHNEHTGLSGRQLTLAAESTALQVSAEQGGRDGSLVGGPDRQDGRAGGAHVDR